MKIDLTKLGKAFLLAIAAMLMFFSIFVMLACLVLAYQSASVEIAAVTTFLLVTTAIIYNVL